MTLQTKLDNEILFRYKAKKNNEKSDDGGERERETHKTNIIFSIRKCCQFELARMDGWLNG